MSTCLFCSFVRGDAACHRVWEDEAHLAFLTPFPNTPGFTVVIPKAHYPSYAFELPEDVLLQLVLAAKVVAGKIDRAFPAVGRTAMVFEGFGIDHVHAKLIPLHGTRMAEWCPINSQVHTYHETYEGFVSTHDGPQADEALLCEITTKISQA